MLPQDNTKAVLLMYTEGGQNWAHQDDNANSPYQMLIMLSVPGEDFSGGELYVLDGNEEYRKHSGAVVRTHRNYCRNDTFGRVAMQD